MTDVQTTTADVQTNQIPKQRNQLDDFSDFVKDLPDATHLIEVFINFRLSQREKKKKESNVMPFGKYKYRTIKDVLEFDRKYLTWLVKQTSLDGYPEIKHNISTLLG